MGSKQQSLGNVAVLQRGFDLPAAQRIEGTVPVVSSGGVTGAHSVSMVKGPGVVTGRYGTVGQVFYVDQDFWPLNTTLWVSDFKGNLPRFVYYLLQSIDFTPFKDKTGVPGVNRNDLHQIPVHCPERESQKTIVRYLDMWERAVCQCESRILAFERRKRALMQQLLTGKRRFKEFAKEKWCSTTLGEAILESTERNQGQFSRERVMAVNKSLGMIPMKAETIAESIDRYKIVNRDWFAYNPMRINIGSIARWCGDSEALVSPDYVVLHCADDKIIPDYLDHLRQSAVWENFVTSAGIGSVRVRIYFDDLGEMPIKLPSIREQTKIAEVLNSADREITLLRHQLDKLKLQKKGLMQQLLTGRVRVK